MESKKIYRITFRKRAAKEYLEAIGWYKERSILAAENFIKAMNEAISQIEAQPDYYRKRYKNFHEIKLHRYPFILIYFVDEGQHVVVVTSVFHHKRNPEKKF